VPRRCTLAVPLVAPARSATRLIVYVLN